MKQAINFASGILTGAIITALVAYFSGGQYRTLFILGFALPILIAVMYPRAIASFLLKIASAKEAFGGTTATKPVERSANRSVKQSRSSKPVVAIDEKAQEDHDWEEYQKTPKGKRQKLQDVLFEAYEEAKAKKQEMAERRTA